MKKASDFFLKKGDVIDVVAPASACSQEELAEGLAWLRAQGYKPRVSPELLDPNMYLANSDQKRLQQLKQALSSSSSKAVWCVRGGYGAIRLVPELLKLKKQKPKIFIGLSDITILHQFLNQKWNWKTIHGPILARQPAVRDQRPQDYQELFSLLEGKSDYSSFANLESLNATAAKNKKVIKATMSGGNLFTFCSLLGTKLQPKTQGQFLFFEDTGERGYKIDRMLQQMDQAGIFKKCKGVFWGDVIKSDEIDGKNYVWPTIEAFFKKASFPVFRGVECGHAEKQRSLFFNTRAELDAKNILRIYTT